MDQQHPVPQDITGFQFKLVGDMTLKQFGELAFGAVTAYVIYASSWYPLFKWPLAFLVGFLGIALAFIPIEERPLDVWIVNFFRAIYRPTYYVWKKSSLIGVPTPPPAMVTTGPILTPPQEPSKEEVKPVEEAKPQVLSVAELEKLRETKLAELEEAKMKLAKKTEEVKTQEYRAQTVADIVTVDKLTEMRDKATAKSTVTDTQLNELIKENAMLLSEIGQVQTKIQTLSGSEKDLLQAQFDALNKRQNNLAEAINTKQEEIKNSPVLSQIPKEPLEPPWASGGGQMRVVDRPVRQQKTISLTDLPNVVNGSVTNVRGMPLEGVILVIKDKAGNSVRALKTNRVGQFVVSTPLENGTYYLEFEFPNYTFNVYEITLDGKVITPLEIRGNQNDG